MTEGEKVRDLVSELRGETCKCGARKMAGQTFCRKCYYKLPSSERQALYNQIGAGYEEAYAAACERLGHEHS